MYTVSQEFNEKMKAIERPKIEGKVQIDYTDPFLDQSIQVISNEQANVSYPQQTADGVAQATYKWASLDGSWVLDGSYHLAPEPEDLTRYQMGWWGSQLAGLDGIFAQPYPTLTVTHIPRPVHTLRVVGDTARGEYPVDFRIDLYGPDDTLLRSEVITGNTAIEWSMALPAPVLDVVKQVLTITKWSHPGRQAKILEFFTSIQEIYYSGDVVEIRLLEEREASQGSLPVGNISANEISIKLANEGGKFDVTNQNSPLTGLLKPNRRIKAWFGLKGDGEGQNITKQEQTQADFQQGTLTNVVATSAGNLELSQDSALIFVNSAIANQATKVKSNLVYRNKTKFTLEAEIYPRDLSRKFQVIVGSVIGNNVGAGLMLNAYDASKLEFHDYISSDVTVVTSPTNTIKANIWQKVKAVYDGSSVEIFVNDISVGKANYTIPTSSAVTIIGSPDNDTLNRAFNGYIRNVKITDGTNILAFWPMNDGAGTIVRDTSGNGWNGTISNLQGWRIYPTEWVGTRISPAIDLTNIGIAASSKISWTANMPTNTSIKIETSLDGGQTWQQCTNGGKVPGINYGDDLSDKFLMIRETLTTTDTTVTPTLQSLTVRVNHEEFAPLGTFWSLDWDSPDDTLEATVTARDRLELLRKSTYQPGQVQQNVSLYTLAEQVLQDAGLESSEYAIDSALQSIIVPWAWLSPTSHREALRIIAEAALAVVYADRDGVVRIESIGSVPSEPVLEITADDYFPPLQAPSRQDQVANEIVVTTQPLKPADTPSEVYRSTTPISVPAGQTVTVQAKYNQPPVIEATASLDNLPAGVSITSATYYAWGAEVSIRNISGANANVTLVITGKPLSVQGGEQVVARDEASITENGVLRYEFPANPLVQTLAQAQAIAQALLASAKDPRRDIEVEWRGNPALELGDRVTVVGQDVHVIRQEIEWAGYLSAKLTGRKVV